MNKINVVLHFVDKIHVDQTQIIGKVYMYIPSTNDKYDALFGVDTVSIQVKIVQFLTTFQKTLV